MESLKEAMACDPEMYNYSQQWLFQTQAAGHGPELAQGLCLDLLYWRLQENQRRKEQASLKNQALKDEACKGWEGWQSHWWQEPWQEAGVQRERPRQLPRYLTRGWGSACKRHAKRGYEARGEPVPDHLKTDRACKSFQEANGLFALE